MTVDDATEGVGQIRNRAERAERSFEDSDTTGILRLMPIPAAKTTSTKTTVCDADVDAVGGTGGSS